VLRELMADSPNLVAPTVAAAAKRLWRVRSIPEPHGTRSVAVSHNGPVVLHSKHHAGLFTAVTFKTLGTKSGRVR
jgi:hypothetical protein